ncbi:4Fe-4S ferredoxin iron-sulfur binding domain-containing protein [Desulfovibrio sp. X2]|uniref:4Fe-4S binding protein n=1 Tax=Desulfovibrio sp. X2 TaxID=941449 RepID=UPI000358D2E9|nr:4Fe-4S binding protein [Desulfovibrio sp. X2]EPR37394.1 4Fe-4S ferredoxin iron-sulfur binding domain-containing protein [Desulfovibrio sp. X2]
MFDFLKILAGNVVKGPSTDPFPFVEAKTPARFRGKVHMNPALCVGCAICRHVCAGAAIHIEERPDGSGYDFALWHNTCALCGLCRHYCPTGAISMSNDWHNAHPQSEKYEWCERHFVPFLSCEGCGAHIRPLPPALAGRIYADNDVDAAHLMRLCPQCRQLESALKRVEADNGDRTHA